MALLLNVPYAEKDEAKALGARWDNTLKKWYVEDYRHYPDFYKWITPEPEVLKYIIHKSVYVIEAVRTCHKCNSDTPVIGFGFKNFVLDETMSVFYDFTDALRLVAFFEPMPEMLLKFVKEKYANGCIHCGTLQGKYFLFEEIDSPFEVMDADELSIYEFPLQYDIVLDEIDEGLINMVPYDEKLVHKMSVLLDR